MNLLDKGKYNSSSKYISSKKKYFEEPIEHVNFIHNYSVKDDGLYFTNFFQRVTGDRNTKIKEVIHKCINEPEFFSQNFMGTEVSEKTPFDIRKKERLHKIIELYDYNADDDKLFKFVPNDNYKKMYGKERGFQLVFEHNNNDIDIRLIDLYHLAIPSAKNQKHEKFDLRSEYERRKEFKKGIEEVIFDKKISLQ